MIIDSKYFEIIQKNGLITFSKVDDFVKEFMKQCKTLGIKVKLVECTGFCKVVRVKQNRFYIQDNTFSYETMTWNWKLYAKAETYQEAMKRINNTMYTHAGDKRFRILDRLENKYY